MPSRPLDGKIALVTGAGKNIGRGIALALADDGAAIVVNGRSDQSAVDETVEAVRASGGTAIGCIADVSDPAAVAAMIETVQAEMGGLDILVSNAGLRRQTPFLEMEFDEWREILSVALDGAFLLARAGAPLMVERGGGAIVALSGVSHRVGTLDRCHVSASKAGLEGLIRALSRELAPHGITCNCVAPGAIDTVRGASAGARPASGAAQNIPLGRFGRVEEIAAMVRHLVRPDGAFITGQTIHVNGGAFLG
ncbi:MAG: SDR family NAD(P)-dependent oxidoreductase [Proteobacteria bacterium]|nr:SDR family NAD(P)-dependent oxidoreductase [Pseudomonadota bacterium]MDA1310228.1 SDR family NAD(P)-dependent oxidoreductase [Pseudomonadota bacterium]